MNGTGGERDALRRFLFCSTDRAQAFRLETRSLDVGRACWYFLIDEDDEAHPIPRGIADAILDGSIPESVPHRDADGVLLVSVGLRLEEGVPSAIDLFELFPLAATDEAKGRPISPLGPAVAQKLCRAIRAKLSRSRIQRVERIENLPCSALKAEILAGSYMGWVYSDCVGVARQRIYNPGGGLRLGG